ncbi:late competence development ComFB family protein [Zooshikella sp. RANM57]|uniref:late competence development ComFB family protein n=1 Tax=Zooshikella sp. RANM57 TaxID=3425863 RepID=UPI003D6E144A
MNACIEVNSMALQEEFHNYYETMVVDYITQEYRNQAEIDEMVVDVACVALNHLPPRYIHHDIDMAYYLSPKERKEMEKKVRDAVEDAIQFVYKRRNKEGEEQSASAS